MGDETADDRPSDLLRRITIDPAVCGGKPCIRGLRMRVSDILDLLAAGVTFGEILGDYDYLEEQDLKAALQYAAESVNRPVEREA